MGCGAGVRASGRGTGGGAGAGAGGEVGVGVAVQGGNPRPGLPLISAGGRAAMGWPRPSRLPAVLALAALAGPLSPQ